MARRRSTTPTTSLLLDAPLAVATDGTLIANATLVLAQVGDDPHGLLDAALATGRQVLVGIALDESEAVEAMKRLDDAAAEIAAMTVKL